MLTRPGAAIAAAAALLLSAPARAAAPVNLFSNASFEMGSGGWRMDKGKGTNARFAVEEGDAADGRRSMRVEIRTVGEWGSQFGQTVEPGTRGKTYTFAVIAKSVGRAVRVQLEIERAGKPYDRALRSPALTLTPEKWTELHATFTVEKDFPQGWFAYISCREANVTYRCDAFRLTEGAYVPYAKVMRKHQAEAGVRLYDTGTASPAPLAPSAVAARGGWRHVPQDDGSHPFKGDAVFANNRLAVVVRQRGRGAEVYAVGPNSMARRAGLVPMAGHAAAERLSAIKIAENGPGAVAVDATFAAGADAITVRYALAMGQAFVATEPHAGTRALAVEAPCRFAVLPDFFADDIVIDAAEMPAAEAELPADHFLLHLAPGGGSIVMAVWNPAGEFIRSTFGGDAGKRLLARSTIPYGKKGKVWVAVLEGERLWHTREVTQADAGKILPLSWHQPFPAQWRMDWQRTDGLTDSWEMIAQRQSGNFTKIGWFGGEGTLPASRKRWTTVLGNFPYPCWIDRNGRGHIQPLRGKKALAFAGPAVLYPINRSRATPLEVFTVVDIVRATLGVGPCEYILDVEGQRSEYKGRATCSNRDLLNRIYEKREQTKRRADIEKSLAEVMVFIRHIRGRIEQYVAFGHDLLAYLAEQKKAHPDLAAPIAELERLARQIDARYAAREAAIKTPAYAAKMVERFKATVLHDTSDDALAKCKQFTKAWVEIGGNQDELVGECRWAVKMVRQRAGLLVARDPRMAEIAREIRRRSRNVLRNPAGHEGARH